jgi:maleate isomerase
MGMSTITFYGGDKGADEFQAKDETAANIGVSIGSHSTTAALRAYGGIERIAFISPYFPAANERVQKYFEDSGFEVVRDICLNCPNGPDVDALVQVGTNLTMAHPAAEAERSLGKTVIAINTATYWNALSTYDITDRISGFGRLLEES